MGETHPSETEGKSSGFFALEEKIASRMEAMAGELESRIAEGESMLVRLRQAERSGAPWPGFSSPSDAETRLPACTAASRSPGGWPRKKAGQTGR